jgi:CHAT domain-containing protein
MRFPYKFLLVPVLGLLLPLFPGNFSATVSAQYPDDGVVKMFEVLPAPKPGDKVSRDTSTDAELNIGYELELDKDEFLEVEVEQYGLAIEIALLKAPSDEMERWFEPTGKYGTQTLAYITPEKGTYLIGIAPLVPIRNIGHSKGSFSLVIKNRRPATDEDRATTKIWRARKTVADYGPFPKVGITDLAQGATLAEEAILFFHQQGNLKKETEARFQLARIHLKQNNPNTVIRELQEILALRKEDNGDLFIERVASTLAEAYRKVGNYHAGLKILKQGLALRPLKENDYEQAVQLYNLGLIQIEIGDDTGARQSLEAARKTFEHGKTYNYLHATKNSLAEILARQGDGRQVLTILEQVIYEKTMESADGPTVVKLLLNIGLAYRQLGNRAKAGENLDLALQQARKRKLVIPEAEALRVLGVLRKDEGKLAEARTLFQQSLALVRSTEIRGLEPEILTNLAQTEAAGGDDETALKAIAEAVQITELLRGAIEDDTLRAIFLGSTQSRYELYYTLLMKLHRQHPTAGNDLKAFLVSERAKARALIDLLRAKSISAGDDQAIVFRRKTLQKVINQANQVLLGLSSSPDDVKRRADLEKQLATAVEEYRDLTTQLQKLNPRFVRLTEPVALDLQEISTQLDENAILLEYALGTEKSFLWAVTRTGLKSYELPGRDEIENLTRKTYDALTARARKVKYEDDTKKAARVVVADREYASLSKELGQLLLGPVAADLAGKQVLVVGDGALLYLPFAALPLPATGNPLVTTCEVTQLPSISTLSVLRQDAAGRRPSSQTVAVFADPVFDVNDARIRSEKSKMSARTGISSVRDDVTRAEAEIDGTDRDGVLSRLPFTRAEAEAIEKLVPKNRRLISLDFKACRDTLFNQDLARYRFVHFATHGLVNSTTPDLSGVVLSMVDEKGQPADGFIHAYEIFNLKLPVEMVVLSACRTGLGKEIRGEGMIGLTRAFLYAGAERVLVSHWSVEDSATSTLMADVYAGMLKRNLHPAAALRASQLKMMADPKHSHPFYWAAFTLQGEPR